MTFPRFTPYRQVEVTPEMQSRRDEYSAKMRKLRAPAPDSYTTEGACPEDVAEGIGQQMFREYGKDCHRLLMVAAAAAMRAERDAMGEV